MGKYDTGRNSLKGWHNGTKIDVYTVCILIVVNDDNFESLIDAECESLSNYTLPAIPHKDKVLCQIPSSCDQVSCCVYMAPVRRHARVDLVVNTCSYQMEAVIDNLRFTRSLFTYTWGKICNLKCTIFRFYLRLLQF